ncbi:MAG: GLUG motif-containing protein, partial [Alphaproteobacteria bacterium]
MELWQTGIFTRTKGATIKNLGIVNAKITGLNNGASLVGYAYSTTISNCYVSGEINSTLSAAALVVAATDSNIINCYSTAKVSGDGAYVGGLVGTYNNSTAVHSYWDTETSGQTTSALGEGRTTAELKQQATFEGWDFANSLWCIRENVSYPAFCSAMSWNMISNCTQLQNMKNNLSGNYQLANDINCSGINFSPIGDTFSSAFTGFFDGKNYNINNFTITCSNCWAGLFKITIGATIQNVKMNNVNINGGRPVGSIAAYAHAKTSIYNCSSSGSIRAPNLVSPYDSSLVGGLVGQLDGRSTISNSYSTANIYAKGSYAGGLAGVMSEMSSITNSYSTGSVASDTVFVGGIVGSAGAKINISNSYSSSPVTGSSYVGGIVGNMHSTSTLSSSYSMGTVNGGSNVGGLVGYLYSGSAISDSFSVSSVNGSGSAVGGLVGYARDDAKISNSYAKGAVSGSSGVGGLVGMALTSTAENSYYDSETTGQSSSALGVSKITADMKHQSTFGSWDFDNTWCITECASYPNFVGNCAANICTGCAVLEGNRCV